MIRSFQNEFGRFQIASQGAALIGLTLDGQELLHDFGAEHLDWAAGALMFPFPVRMASGTVMHFDGQEYHWPINDEKHQAALHGLSPWEEFELTEVAHGIEASWYYDGSLDHFPFPCELIVSYQLHAKALILSCKVNNVGSSTLPFHIGWHPYFKVGHAPILTPTPTKRLKKNQWSHPQDFTAFDAFDWTREVDGAFDMKAIQLAGESHDVWVEPLSRITQIFRPANAPFVAIEPISGLGHGDFPWKTVAPGRSQKIQTTIRLERR